jgi:hypothetical protein
MWNTFSHYLARVLTWAWFTGAALMIITIPACAIKIFSALWEDHEEDAPITDKVGKQNPA